MTHGGSGDEFSSDSLDAMVVLSEEKESGPASGEHREMLVDWPAFAL
jgi:hypothetical protein